MDNKSQPITENDSIEMQPDSLSQTGVVNAPTTSESGSVTPSPMPSKRPENKLKQLTEKLNIYFILLMVLLLALGGISYYAIIKNRQSAKDNSLNTQTLNQEALDKLAGTDSTIGDSKQILNIESNAIFNGGVLVRGNIDVAGTIKVGGTLSLPGLSVGGTTSVDQLASKSMTVSGDAAIQGKLSIQGSLSVNGATSFNGPLSAVQLTVDSLQMSKDLQLNRHILGRGGTPGRTNGSALGSGGTSSVSGSDSGGTVSINTGSGAPVGCFMTITFAVAYSSVPHVIISPSSSSAAALDYYVNRTATGFSICTASDPPDSTSGILFDYFVIG